MERQMEWAHFIGIGGSGMSGLAKILLEIGVKVSGSDQKLSKTTKELTNLGAQIYQEHSGENILPGITMVIRSTAIPPDNPELVKAQELHIPIIHRGELLAKLTEKQKTIAVAGAHGKTTTTSMLATIFYKHGLDPTVAVGGKVLDIGSNAKYGKGEYLVAEADESDGSFLKLHPYVAVVTNIEDDHLDHYGSVENIIKAFEQFISLVPQQGFCVLCADDSELARIAGNVPNAITYGLTGNPDYKAEDIEYGNISRSKIYYKKEFLGILELLIPGRHNISNALGAIAVGHQLGIEFSAMAQYLKSFHGAGRRFETVGEHQGIHIVDDYAHHPTEVKATLQAAKQLNPKRLLAVFQPHRYTRTKQLFKEFGTSFAEADKVIVTNIYAASEQPIVGVSAQLIVNEMKNQGKDVLFLPTREDVIDYLSQNGSPGDLILTIGAGDICTVGPELLAKLNGA
ncbi:UDP-N-acetylmuramate--L-alanine ligase [Bacillota bacterium LX-D]|nr:UDP-N-acetylmuramate--L-alanine ligase [Bacillota bacterium LX-D]